jgi:hypothetical protein
MRVTPLLARILAYRIVRILSASSAERNQLMHELVGSMFPLLEHGTTFCDCMPPQLIAALAEWGLRDYLDASAHLKHYLTGGGKPKVEDIPRMLREDLGARTAIEQWIALKSAATGDLPDTVGQGSWSTNNWEYALGNVDLFSYEILQDNASKAANVLASDGTAAVRVSIRDPYEWHPDEWRRIPCLHTGMEAMRASGAKDFLAIGDGVVRLSVPKSLLPLP